MGLDASARNRHRSLAIQRVDNNTPRKNERTSLFVYFLGGAKSTKPPRGRRGRRPTEIAAAVVGYVVGTKFVRRLFRGRRLTGVAAAVVGSVLRNLSVGLRSSAPTRSEATKPPPRRGFGGGSNTDESIS